MPKICPQCHKTYEAGKFCLDCGIPLIEQLSAQQSSEGGFSLNLGDANVISGGVNMSDNHSISNNSVSNVDSHNVITNNITHVERDKSPEELKHERELEFRKACQEAYANGILTNESKVKLENIKHALNIEDTDAFRIIADVSNQIKKRYDQLTPRHQSTLRNTKTAIVNNRLDMIERLLPDLRIMSKLYSDNEVQFFYYMLLAVLHPDKCVEESSKQIEDVYWQTFWASLAFCRLGNSDKSAKLAASLDFKWVDSSVGNGMILDATKYLLSGERDLAKDRLEEVGDFDVELNSLLNCLMVLLDSESLGSEDLKMAQEEGSFYLRNLFAGFTEQENERTRQQEEMRLQKEAEAKRKAAEEEKQRQEAEKHRIAEEKRLAEEARMKEENAKKAAQQVKQVPSVTESKKKQDDILSNPSLLFGLKDKTASDQMSVYKSLLEQASKGNGKAGSYLAYFYIRGVFVDQDLKEAEKRIMGGNYQSDPVLMQLLVELYTAKKVPALAEIWKRKLSNIKK